MVFSNVDEELEKLKELKALAEEINKIEIGNLYLGVEEISKALRCSERAAREFMNMPGFPLIKIGKPMVNIIALNEYTQQRIVMSESK